MLYYILKVGAIIAAFQMILLILFFNSRKNRNPSNKLLSLILLVYTMQICAIVFMSSFQEEILIKYNIFPAFCNQFALLFGPLIWFYSKSIIDEKINKPELWHLSPFVIMLLFMSVTKIIDPNHLFWLTSFSVYSSGFILAQIMFYLLYSGYHIYRKFDKYKNFFNQSANSQLLYGLLLASFILLWVLKFNTFLFMDIWHRYGVCPITTSSFFVTGFLFFNILVYLALIKPELFSWKRKYQNTNIAPSKKEQILNELITKMTVEKVYSDSSLNLSELAKRIGTSTHYLSQLINEEFNISFPDFVNGYRIKEAKHLIMVANDKYTIQQIMYEVGFNSKSVFNTAFKKQTGYTPSQIRQKTYY